MTGNPAPRRLLPQGIGAVLGQVVNAATTFALVLIVARTLGAASAGQYLIGVTIATALTTVARAGATTGLVYKLPRCLRTGRASDAPIVVWSALGPAVVTGLVLAVVAVAGAGQLSNALYGSKPGTSGAEYLAWCCAAVPFWAVATAALAAARGFGKVWPYIALELIGRPALQLGTIAVVATNHPSARGFGAAWFLPFVFEAVLAVLAARAAWRGVRPGGSTAFAYTQSYRRIFADYWRYTTPQAISEVFQAITQRLDVVLVGAMVSPVDAGVYGAATRYLAPAGMLLSSAIVVVGPPLSVAFASKRLVSAKMLYQQSSAAVTALGVPFYLVLIAFAPSAMSLFGAAFNSGAAALVVMSMAMCIGLAAGPVATTLALSGKTVLSGGVGVASGLAMVAADVILIPRYGMVGAACGVLIGYSVANVIPAMALWHVHRIQPFGQAGLVALESAGALSAVVVPAAFVFGRDPGVAVPATAVGTAAWCGVMWRHRRQLVAAGGIGVAGRSPIALQGGRPGV